MRRFQQTSDAAAMDELVSRYYRPALLVAEGLLQNAAAAEDAVQEAFLKNRPGRAQYDSTPPLCRVVLTPSCATVVLTFRGRKAAGWIMLKPGGAGRTRPRPCARRRGHDRAPAFPAPADCEILICRFVHNMTFPEIAEQTGESVDAVKKRGQRALRRLRMNNTIPEA